MKALIVYDSWYGHTKMISEAIGSALAEALSGDVAMMHVSEADATETAEVDLLVLGSPTHGGKPSEATREFLELIQAPALQGVRVAGFDTRVTNVVARLLGFAAPKISKALVDKGGTLAGTPGEFYVTGGKGPLKAGELERAAEWASELVDESPG